MLSPKLISYLKSKNLWFDDYSAEYMTSLTDLGLAMDSDFAQFYLHAEDGPTFYARNQELYQLCWFIINSGYMEHLTKLKNVLSLPDSFLSLDSFAGEGGYFYDKQNDHVYLLELTPNNSDKSYHVVSQWASFNDFLIWYFAIE